MSPDLLRILNVVGETRREGASSYSTWMAMEEAVDEDKERLAVALWEGFHTRQLDVLERPGLFWERLAGCAFSIEDDLIPFFRAVGTEYEFPTGYASQFSGSIKGWNKELEILFRHQLDRAPLLIPLLEEVEKPFSMGLQFALARHGFLSADALDEELPQQVANSMCVSAIGDDTPGFDHWERVWPLEEFGPIVIQTWLDRDRTMHFMRGFSVAAQHCSPDLQWRFINEVHPSSDGIAIHHVAYKARHALEANMCEAIDELLSKTLDSYSGEKLSYLLAGAGMVALERGEAIPESWDRALREAFASAKHHDAVSIYLRPLFEQLSPARKLALFQLEESVPFPQSAVEYLPVEDIAVSVVEELVDGYLYDDTPDFYRQRAFLALGEAAAAPLIERLQSLSQSHPRWFWLVDFLGTTRSEEALRYLVTLLKTSAKTQLDVICLAIAHLAIHHEDVALALLEESLMGGTKAVRSGAIAAFAALAPTAARANAIERVSVARADRKELEALSLQMEVPGYLTWFDAQKRATTDSLLLYQLLLDVEWNNRDFDYPDDDFGALLVAWVRYCSTHVYRDGVYRISASLSAIARQIAGTSLEAALPWAVLELYRYITKAEQGDEVMVFYGCCETDEFYYTGIGERGIQPARLTLHCHPPRFPNALHSWLGRQPLSLDDSHGLSLALGLIGSGKKAQEKIVDEALGPLVPDVLPHIWPLLQSKRAGVRMGATRFLGAFPHHTSLPSLREAIAVASSLPSDDELCALLAALVDALPPLEVSDAPFSVRTSKEPRRRSTQENPLETRIEEAAPPSFLWTNGHPLVAPFDEFALSQLRWTNGAILSEKAAHWCQIGLLLESAERHSPHLAEVCGMLAVESREALGRCMRLRCSAKHYFDAIVGSEASIDALGQVMEGELQSKRNSHWEDWFEVMCRSNTYASVQWLDHWAHFARKKDLRKRALDACRAKAMAQGVEEDELLERAMPHFGFSSTGELKVNAKGPQEGWRLAFQRDGTLYGYDSQGKRKKALPKSLLATEIRTGAGIVPTVKALRKCLPDAIERQVKRLKAAMLVGRAWTSLMFREHILTHPINQRISEGLIWRGHRGTGEGDGLFVLSLEKGCIDERGEACDIDAFVRIDIPHVLALTDDQKAAFSQLLASMTLTPVFPQLDARVVVMDAASGAMDALFDETHEFPVIPTVQTLTDAGFLSVAKDRRHKTATREFPLGWRVKLFHSGYYYKLDMCHKDVMHFCACDFLLGEQRMPIDAVPVPLYNEIALFLQSLQQA